MNGMEMLLQSFGVNTEEVKANVESAVALVRLMNEQLAHLKESVDRIEAKQGQQIELLTLLEDRTRREEWPPQVTQTLNELHEVTNDARRIQGTASNNAASRGSGRG